MSTRNLQDRLVAWLYQRLGHQYWLAIAGGQIAVSVSVVVVTLAALWTFLQPDLHTSMTVLGVATVCAVFASMWAATGSRQVYALITSWQEAENPTDGQTVAAWRAATTLTFVQYRRRSLMVNIIVIAPTLVTAALLMDLGWTGVGALALAVLGPAAWGTFLAYSTGEYLCRPLIEDLAESLPVEFPFARNGLPIGLRLKAGLPSYTIVSGVGVAALLSEYRGVSGMVLATIVAIAVGGILSGELAVLLTRAVIEPVEGLRRGMSAVGGGDFSVKVPVVSSDEMGELAHEFNRMARGLAEREEMREAFGTYVDRAVVELILSGQFPPDGVEVDVSVLFCDVLGFTSYAENASAREVISSLNALFELMVPVITSHGGHVDKFIGDGLLAVFGAPIFHADHADRALAAACDIVAAVAASDHPLEVGVGINSGQVVAGSVGGAGRLNFSVIGDVVNVAARVEAATRTTGDPVLFTAATRDRLSKPTGQSRGSVSLKGKSEPVELFAATVAGEDNETRAARLSAPPVSR